MSTINLAQSYKLINLINEVSRLFYRITINKSPIAPIAFTIPTSAKEPRDPAALDDLVGVLAGVVAEVLATGPCVDALWLALWVALV